jgi:hypothetical protein
MDIVRIRPVGTETLLHMAVISHARAVIKSPDFLTRHLSYQLD